MTRVAQALNFPSCKRKNINSTRRVYKDREYELFLSKNLREKKTLHGTVSVIDRFSRYFCTERLIFLLLFLALSFCCDQSIFFIFCTKKKPMKDYLYRKIKRISFRKLQKMSAIFSVKNREAVIFAKKTETELAERA